MTQPQIVCYVVYTQNYVISNINTFHVSITHTITCPGGNSDFYSIIIRIILYQLDIHGIVINSGLMDYLKVFSARRGPYDFAFLYSAKNRCLYASASI